MSVDATRYVWKLPKSAVSPFEKLILLAIADRCGESGECWPSIARICKDTNLSEDSVIKYRQNLIKKGILKYTGMFMGRSKQIPVMKLMVDDWREGTPGLDSFDPPPVATGRCQRGVEKFISPPGDGGGYHPPVATQNLKEEPKRKDLLCAHFFETFWTLYPKKKAKDSCKIKWKAKNLDKHAEEIIAKLKEQIDHDDEWRHGFIPNPLTYINQNRWKDDITPPKPKTPAIQERSPVALKEISPAIRFNGFMTDFTLCQKRGHIQKDATPPSIKRWEEEGCPEQATAYAKKYNIWGVSQVSKKP
jgi:hypothetical protein